VDADRVEIGVPDRLGCGVDAGDPAWLYVSSRPDRLASAFEVRNIRGCIVSQSVSSMDVRFSSLVCRACRRCSLVGIQSALAGFVGLRGGHAS
jgi:hypothetical protein